MKKLVACAVFLGLFTFGCDLCPEEPPYFDIVGIRLENGPYSLNTAGDSAKFESYEILAWFEKVFYSQNSNKTSFISTAIAHSCAGPGNLGSKEKFEKIEISALSDYNSNFKNGALLNPIIEMGNIPAEDYIQKINYAGIKGSRISIRFTQKPDSTVKHAFRVTFTLTNGEKYISETNPVFIY